MFAFAAIIFMFLGADITTYAVNVFVYVYVVYLACKSVIVVMCPFINILSTIHTAANAFYYLCQRFLFSGELFLRISAVSIHAGTANFLFLLPLNVHSYMYILSNGTKIPVNVTTFISFRMRKKKGLTLNYHSVTKK